MTDDTRNCDEVGKFLEDRYPELREALLVIHTKNNGEISEASSGKSKGEMENLRKESREIDHFDNKFIPMILRTSRSRTDTKPEIRPKSAIKAQILANICEYPAKYLDINLLYPPK